MSKSFANQILTALGRINRWQGISAGVTTSPLAEQNLSVDTNPTIKTIRHNTSIFSTKKYLPC